VGSFIHEYHERSLVRIDQFLPDVKRCVCWFAAIPFSRVALPFGWAAQKQVLGCVIPDGMRHALKLPAATRPRRCRSSRASRRHQACEKVTAATALG
jgi:hypothetical protein